ncbi:helix-turn-helix domain-containing protein [Cellulomonas fimi]|uniref:helix-turn-helix transcriptional regulator n=1 Tax=Cellulomonas fimi TaxID=1708 RepID=UPI00234E0F01|nr:helix-turn-helix domain-containing protein [Cellulomonas fimi]MDC7122382.1 helix-turn-helix domain-containing protein [Cellulomonas fimi]
MNEVTWIGDDPLLRTAEVAPLLRCSPETLRVWRYRRQGPPYVKAGRQVLYRRSAVVQWLEDHTERAVG